MPSTDRIINITSDEVIKRMKADLKNPANKIEGSFASDNIQAVGKEVAKYYGYVNYLHDMHYVMTASGRFLDAKAMDEGITRKQATKPRGFVTFTGTDGTFIPQGYRVSSDNYGFLTIESGTINNGNIILEVEAEEAGQNSNLPVGAITKFSPLNGITSVTNTLEIENGTDVESDEDLRNRTLLKMRYPGTSGNKYHYMHWAMEVEGVGRVKVFPLWNGNGTVKVSILDSNQRQANEHLMAKVKTHIDGDEEAYGEALAPIGATLTVSTAEEIPINIEATVIPIEGDVDISALSYNLSAITQDYFDGIAYTDYTRITAAKIIDILYGIDGVKDITSLTINGSTNSINLSDEEIPVVGTVSLV